MNPKAFAKLISHYDLIPESLLAPVAIGLPVVEILAGLGLIFAIRGSLSIIFGLLMMFAIVLWFGILKNLDIDCGCFSPQELKSHAGLWHAFYRDLIMIVAVLYLYLSRWVQSGRKIRLSLLTKIHQN
jgi:prepilin signal peptidase PulO-like enzyme (type II secretory pathway)